MSEQEMEGRPVQSSEQRRDALAERIFGSSIGFMEILSIYLGDRLGFYRALADNGAATASELADATAAHERYAREWLEQQAVAGILEVQSTDAEPEERRYLLPEGHDGVKTPSWGFCTVGILIEPIIATKMRDHMFSVGAVCKGTPPSGRAAPLRQAFLDGQHDSFR